MGMLDRDGPSIPTGYVIPNTDEESEKAMSDTFESAEQIRARWNQPTSNGGLVRMIGDDLPEGDGRATAAAGNGDNESFTSSKVDAGLQPGVTTLTVPAAVEDGYAEYSFQDLEDEINERNSDRDEGDEISKGGSADDLRDRLREDDASAAE